ncbi:hypothetical protein LPJ59_002018 [Coemansia sp. RSA 2399]|nr:hypothetical protein LPJ59_002018 [Coemansia sp. RSA 2399]
MTHQLSLALTRNQYSLECGGVLLDPATNEVCLLFYPDTSEWRLPMGKPDAMDHHHQEGGGGTPPAGADPSVVGCEPPAHAAQRQISLITGYRCTHLHPAVAAYTKESSSACAYIGPHMVEPLALQIEQRLVAAQPSSSASDSTSNNPSMDLGPALANVVVSAAAVADDDYQLPRSSSTRLVMTYYYTAWLTQGRFEAKAATLPVGPAASNGSDGVLTLGANTTTGKAGLPLAEVTWFKMDTAAQVLTHESDKLALREAIHRLTRLPVPVSASQARYSAVALASQHQQQKHQQQQQQHEFTSGDLFGAKISDSDLQQSALLTTTSVDVVVAAGAGAQTANASSVEQSTTSASSSSSSSSSMSDGATKADDSNPTTKMTTGRPSNMDILRKTATSISKRGGSLFAKSKAAAAAAAIPVDSSNDNNKQMVVVSVKEKTSKKQSPTQNTNKQQITTAAVTAATTGKQAIVPRVMSIFYKLVGPAASSNNNNT